MNNRVVFAAAGNGKTYSICESALRFSKTNPNKNVLLITYTNEGTNALIKEFKKQNCGVLEPNVIIKTWFSFLLSDFIKPYQIELKFKLKRFREEIDIRIPENHVNSIDFYSDDKKEKFYNKTHYQYYFHYNNDLWKDDVADLAIKCCDDSNGKPIKRLEDIYSQIYIDELQDYAGWDLEIIKLLFDSSIDITCVGDYKQATFRTNNSPKNKQYRDFKIKNYFLDLQRKKICTVEFNNTTRRCCKELCKFINSIYSSETESNIESDVSVAESKDYSGVYIMNRNSVDRLLSAAELTFLRYNKTIQIPWRCDEKYNYGASKGLTFDNVVVIPVGTVIPFLGNGADINSEQTKAKFYVACTRAKHMIVFVLDSFRENEIFKTFNLNVNGTNIECFKYKD